MNIKETTALITVASKGIGRATAIRLAQEGSIIVVDYNSDKDLANEVVIECNKYTSGNIAVQADVTNDHQVKEMFNKVKVTFGHLDILVNNAGIFDETDNPRNLQAFENIFQHNFLGHVRVTNEALDIMKKGKIVNVSSIHGQLGIGNGEVIAYASLKAAINSYTKNLAKELAPDILVNAVAPGRTMTTMWSGMTKEEEKKWGETQLINRFIIPDEVADAIRHVPE